MLRKNRTIKNLSVNQNDKTFQFNNGLYVISARYITIIDNNPHLFYFEGLPTALNVEQKDHGQIYAGQLTTHYLIVQLNPFATGKGENIFAMIGEFLSDPRRVVFLILLGTVAWAYISSGGQI
jgi:hypothetical protein